MILVGIIEKEHSKKQTEKAVKHIDADQKKFKELMALVLGKDKVLAQRGAWVMSEVYKIHPHLLTKYIKQLVALLQQDVHDGIKRHILKTFQTIPLPEDQAALVINICYDLAASQSVAKAIRAWAMSAILNASRNYPELLVELDQFLNELIKREEIPAILARARLVLKEMKKSIT